MNLETLYVGTTPFRLLPVAETQTSLRNLQYRSPQLGTSVLALKNCQNLEFLHFSTANPELVGLITELCTTNQNLKEIKIETLVRPTVTYREILLAAQKTGLKILQLDTWKYVLNPQ
eukprot:TRINITY_DN388_c0_g1_i2.p1 TRINITY_DN388_c0_g1~~TRINITY_DN388_c0_g1_i2.p1  ORF type:complete len:117 (+),score=12.26 TRINITY_DN388_c0_g1_i2:142-492(+)